VTSATVRIDALTPHPRNYNRHPASQLRKLTKSLRKFGQVRSIVVWRNFIIAGHGLTEAARAAKWETLRADVLPDDYPEHLALAYVAADNELARQGDPDTAQLLTILEESRATDAELLEAIGFDDADYQRMLTEVSGGGNGKDTEPQVDRAEELRQKWNVSTGDLWQLGEHRLICGDCTDAAVVARVMGGELTGLVFGDPPYNCASENGIYGADVSKAMAGLKAAEWDRDFDLRPALDALPLAHDVTVYLCSSHHLAPVIWEWMGTWASLFSWCVWSKPNPMPSLAKRHWTWNAELIPYATRGKHTFNFPANGHALCVWTIGKAKVTDHPTEKPVEVPEHAIAHSSKAGDLVFDGFSGSGTTLIACENLGRRCRAVEIAPGYVAVALERFYQHSGKVPVLVSGE